MIKYLPFPVRRFLNNRLYPVSRKEKEFIATSNPDLIAQWYLTLNSWEWPDELLPAEPARYITGGRRTQLMDLITSRVGIRFLLRKHNHQMTDYEFNDWWENQSLSNPKNKHLWD